MKFEAEVVLAKAFAEWANMTVPIRSKNGTAPGSASMIKARALPARAAAAD